MSGSGMDRSNAEDLRYDCFISIRGTQKLRDLGFTKLDPEYTVRDLAGEVCKRLSAFDRRPAVFYDKGGLEGGPYKDDLSNAVLQLRGGGVALVLLTADYLRRKWCIAELHTFLELYKLGREGGSGKSEAVEIRVFCLEPGPVILSALSEHTDGEFVGGEGGVQTFQWKWPEQGPSESTRARVVQQICGHVRGYWDERPSICLGRDLKPCVYYLRGFFDSSPASVSLISAALRVGADGVVMTREIAFDQALKDGKFTDFHRMDALSRTTTSVTAIAVLKKFCRKWLSEGWEWSLEPGQNDICLKQSIDEAASVLLSGVRKRRLGRDENPGPLKRPCIDSGVTLSDVFRPYLPDQQHSSDDLEASAATSLARLKAAVLPAESGFWATLRARLARGIFFWDAPDSSSSLRPVTLTSINGEGGVGKTSTCKLLCADKDVRRHFSNGAIVWIDVGQGATEGKVKSELGDAVLGCGGEHSAGLIGASRMFRAAVDMARSFFSKRRILVVIDNVWETPEKCSVMSWTAEISRIATYPGSAVVMTTRFDSLSRSLGFDAVHLGRFELESADSPDWLVAEKLFDKLLGVPRHEQLAGSYRRDRKKALELSCGLPIAIKTFACLVQHRMQIGDGVGSVLDRIGSRATGLAGRFVGDDLKAVVGHRGLFAAMEESLAFLDEQKGPRMVSTALTERKDGNGQDVRSFCANYDGFPGFSLSSRYYALNMLPASSTRISLAVLCRLWHLRDVGQAEDVALLFVNIGLGRIEKVSPGQDSSTGVLCLHDLQYEFCTDIRDAYVGATYEFAAVASPSTVGGHALLLSSCESLLGPEKDGDDMGMGWAQFCFAEGRRLSEAPLRRYLTRNLFRHLCGAAHDVDDDGVERTVMSVLSDFGWLRGRIAVDGRSSAILDCITALASQSSSSAEIRLLTGGAEKSIRALQQCLMLVGEGVSLESDGTLAGALVQLCQSAVVSGDDGMDTAFFKKLACSSESGVRGPWVKPVRGCSRSRDRGVLVQATVGSGGKVRSLVAFGDGEHFVSGSADGVVRVHDYKRLGAVMVLSGHTDEVNCVDVEKREGSQGSVLLCSGSQDGTVRCWEVEHDITNGFIEKAAAVVGDCGRPVWCLSVSKSGDLVAAGCYNGLVFVWKRPDGGSALLFELVASFRCSEAEDGLGWVNGVAVSRSGDLVVAGEQGGGIVFWSSGGSGSEGSVDRYSASDESGADLRHVLLSEDAVSVNFVFDEPSGCEVWDVASKRRRSPRVALPDFKALNCAILSAEGGTCAEGSGARGVLAAGGWDENEQAFLSLHSPSDDFKVLSTISSASPPRSVCCTSFGGSKRILVGSDDGCVRMLDADVTAASDRVESYEEGAGSLRSGRSAAPDAPELDTVYTVAVMPAAELVVAGHKDGQFSLWRAASGDFLRAFEDERGSRVYCFDFSSDERLAVSGHWNGIALVWDASVWECRFALEGHSEPVVCATISADANRIVTVDWGGELRLWDAEIGGAALLTIETGLEFSFFGSRGAISLDGGLFLWAARDDDDRNWRGKVIDFINGTVIWNCEEARHFDWDEFLKEMMSDEAFGGKKEAPWRSGAVWCNRFVELPDADSGQQSADGWRVSSGDGRGDWIPRIECVLRSAEGGTMHAAASLGFDCDVESIAAGWMRREAGGRRRAVVACELDGRSHPAIMHFYPSN